MEYAICYSDDNYWCALTDGKMKYSWFLYSGKEQQFDFQKDLFETTEVSTNKKYKKELGELRIAMIEHLRERATEWVKDDKLVMRDETLLYSSNYPVNKAEK